MQIGSSTIKNRNPGKTTQTKIKKSNKDKSYLFEKVDKINKLLPRQIRRINNILVANI